jgi:hypothetical protein
LVGELDLESLIEESVAEGPPTMQAMTQDEDIGKSKWYEKKSWRQQRQR